MRRVLNLTTSSHHRSVHHQHLVEEVAVFSTEKENKHKFSFLYKIMAIYTQFRDQTTTDFPILLSSISYESYEPIVDLNSDFGSNFSTEENLTAKELPLDMRFNDGHRLGIIAYSLMMIVSVVGNITVFSVIVRCRMGRRCNRVNLLQLHLTIADLIVTFFLMPLEIGWHATVSWQAGDAMCRLMAFLRIFGLYLSGFVIVCISIDRLLALLKPVGLADAENRARKMLGFAWAASIICSLPQAYIFHVEIHPEHRWYHQCVTFNSFPRPEIELAYNLTGFFFLYVFPLIIIVFCYSRILCEIYWINKRVKNDVEIRTPNMEALERAKRQTLKMTVIIVLTFCLCWTPYNIMSLWYWFDKKSALQVDQLVQKGLFLFACANSCVNPLIYGFFYIRSRQLYQCIPRWARYCIQRQTPRENYKLRVRWKPNGCYRLSYGEGNGNGTEAPGE